VRGEVSEDREAERPSAPSGTAAGTAAAGLVAIGASAGGLEAFERFFRAVPPASGLAYVALQHLSPQHESILPQLLSAFSPLPVENAVDGTRPSPDRIYVIPPNATLLLIGGRLRLQPLEPRATRHPIDAFLESLARELGPRGAGVILSGTGGDGAVGLHALRVAGGVTAAQTPGEAEYDAMPRRAIATGDVEFVLPAGDLPALLARELARRAAAPGEGPAAAGGGEPADPLDAVIRAAARHVGRDLRDYKRATLGRRVRRRVDALGLPGLPAYAARLERDAGEARLLLDELMISVTQFFRDPESFQVLARVALPELIRAGAGRTVRAWVPGCATGEEAYTLAILLREEARRTGQPEPDLQVFATDVDAPALALARRAVYPAAIRAVVPPELLGRWFQQVEGGFEVIQAIRDTCLFSLHDVLQDPPFSRLDLVSCRNLLIYFELEAQQRLLPIFHYALRPGGVLFLGGAEQVDERAPGLEAVDRAHRVFRRSDAGPPASLPLSLLSQASSRRRMAAPPLGQRVDAGRARAAPETAPAAAPGGEAPDAAEQARAANEALQVANEQLQSANQELQVSQEELQSVNEELHTVNAELQKRVDELNGLYADARNLNQATGIAIVFLGRDLRIARFTPAAERLFPLTVGDVGRPLEDLQGPFDPAVIGASARAALEGKRPPDQVAALPDGSASFLLRALPYQRLDGTVDGVVLTFADVTALKLAEEALRAAEGRERRRASELDAIMRGVPAGVWIARDAAATDVVGNATADRILRAPLGGGALLARGAGGPPGLEVRHQGRVLAPRDQPVQRAAATGAEVNDFEQELWFADGSHVHLYGHAVPLRDAGGRPAGAVGAFLDVTRLKHAEDEVRRSEQRFRASMETLLDGFALVTPVRDARGAAADFAVEFANGPACAILGIEDPVPGERLLVLRPLPESAALLELLQAADRGEPVRREQVRGGGLGGDGPAARRVFDVQAARLVGGAVVVAWHDDTERSAGAEALREADRRKDDFLAMLGHELRNPLTALQHGLEVARRQVPEGHPVGPTHDMMKRQVRQLRRLVDDLLDVTRITRGTIRLREEPVDLAEACRAEVALQRGAAGGRLTLALSSPEGGAWILGDGDRVGQIVGNLVGNACKFTDAGGTVRVSVEPGEAATVLRVRDDGIGMAPETLARAFEPFHQAERTLARSRGGLGLGLALVKRLAEQMGGAASAHSAGLGRGSELVVRFRATASPRAAGPAEAPGGAGMGAPPARRLRVAIVEDNPDAAAMLAELVSSIFGHEVLVAHDGQAGLDLALQRHPDVVLCDIGLPVLDGFGVATAIRRAPPGPAPYLVALTGYGRHEDVTRAREAGFDRHFTKPIDLDELRRLLADLASGRPRGQA